MCPHVISLYFQRDQARIKGLSNRLIQSIDSQVEHVVRNGDVNGYPGCVNLSFSYVEGESLLMALKVQLVFSCVYCLLTQNQGYCTFIRKRVHLGFPRTVVCA
jgi:cysteine sulfinate desulfinase/cysteine desulfurase-like protein